MGIPVIQIPSLILPAAWTLGTEHEDIDDLLEHASQEFYIADIDEKQVNIVAIENVVAGIPGNLWCWVELSPVPTLVSAAYWAAIAGGGGPVAPVAPFIIVGTGVLGAFQTLMLPWAIHSAFARVVVQTPVAPGLPGAFWQVQVAISGKTA